MAELRVVVAGAGGRMGRTLTRIVAGEDGKAKLALTDESDLLETSDRERVEVDAKIDLAVAEIRTETEIEFDRLIRNGSETPMPGTKIRYSPGVLNAEKSAS